MDANSPYWYWMVAIGGGILSVVPMMGITPALTVGTAIGAAIGIGIWIYIARRVVGWITDRHTSYFPNVMTPRAYTLAILISYAYVGWNINVLFPVSPGEHAVDLVIVAWTYATVLLLLTLIVKVVYRRNSDQANITTNT